MRTSVRMSLQGQIRPKSWSLRMAALGHEDQFPPAALTDRYRFA
jgi:hypothetical protein